MEIKPTIPQVNRNQIEKAVRMILEAIGEDPNREGLLETPQRVSKAFAEIFGGYAFDFSSLKKNFTVKEAQEIEIKGIKFYSMCEHHILPFFGECNIKFVPKEQGEIIGLSKIPRLVKMKARKLQVQEQLTYEIAEELQNLIECQSLEVEIIARHLCVEMRGINETNSETITRYKK